MFAFTTIVPLMILVWTLYRLVPEQGPEFESRFLSGSRKTL